MSKIDNSVSRLTNTILHIIFLSMCFACLYPVFLVLGISFSSSKSLIEQGYRMIPKEFSLESYNYIFTFSDRIFRAYGLTIIVTIVGAILSVLTISFYAYPLSRNDFKYKKFFTFFIFFTMLFNGGMVPWYMVCVTIGLKDNFWALVLPYLMNTWNTIIMRTFFQTTIPASLIESAKIDGAGEFRIFFQMVLPLSLPGLATIGLFVTLAYWNDWWLPMMLTEKAQWQNLQFMLQSMMKNIQQIQENKEYLNALGVPVDVPSESARMALCLVALGPIVIAYPFFQKYFVSGLTIGAIKG